MSKTAYLKTAGRPQFDLFLSYASEDRQLKVAGKQVSLILELKRRLETHRLPGRGRFRVCSYEEDFDLSDTVLSAIREKIRDARAGLVLCSKAASSKDYVRRELEIFQEEGKELIAAQVSIAV